MSVRMIPVLVGAGCLDGELRQGRLVKRAVTVASVVAFPEKYVTTSRLAHVLKTNTATVVGRLTCAGIKHMVPSDSRSGISSIWPRAAAFAALGVSLPAATGA